MRITLFISICLLIFKVNAQLQTPEQFLGYSVGTKVTPHWKIIDYYRHVQQQVPEKVQMKQYGTSVEGRPLYLAYVSSEENLKNLENIRRDNLKLANIESGSASATHPAIVWMSYNVHGNEISSAEASMMTLYDLVDSKNDATKNALEKVLVILDPCLNPDGTERYVNWYNGVVGSAFNPSSFARERSEPWPGGRPNHYYFDLNRDWAWQTQQESRQRIAVYNQWLPHVHVDFHEQGINNPYYFPPAAEPFHEVITPWQRSFQGEIGKYNASYFDRQGWLYFTKERFDLFYPSYGDTYPTYNGAVGMTYEQAGNSAGGLGVLTADKDTLTLVDRAKHHHASGLNAVQVVAQQSSKVVSEFKKFFDDAVSGRLSSFQSYVIKYQAKDHGKFIALKTLLDNNGIQYAQGKGAVKGIDYATKKEVAYTMSNKDMVISGRQPKAALVRVLFEPEAKLVDSVTYDITAWSIPYVYGLDAIASKQEISSAEKYALDSVRNTVSDSYGYAIKWEAFNSAQFLAELLKNKIKVRSSVEDFVVDGVTFPRGSLIVLAQANAAVQPLKQRLSGLADKHQVQLYPIKSGIVDKGKDIGSDAVASIDQHKAVLFTGKNLRSINVGEVWHYFDQQLGYPITLVDMDQFGQIKWNEVDVLILTSGSYPFLRDKNHSAQLASWVRAGGKIIAMESAVDQVRALEWTKLGEAKKDTTKKKEEPKLAIYADRERSAIRSYSGGAIYNVKVDATHPLMFGYERYYTIKLSSTIYPYFEENEGWNVGYIEGDGRMSGFVGETLNKRLKNGLIFGVEPIGRGTVVYLTDNILFRNFWENGKLMMANALFQVK